MKRVIFVTISMRGGGTERVISVLANCMFEMGYEVEIMMIGDCGVEYQLAKGIKCLSVSGATHGNGLERIKRILNMRKHIRKDPSARIIAMGTVAGIFSAIATIGLKNEVVVSERNDPGIFNGHGIKMHETFIRNISYLLAKSIVLQVEDAISYFPNYLKKKCLIIENPLPDDLPFPSDFGRREKLIIAIGRLLESKNHEMLIRVFSEIHKKYPDYKLYIYGEGSHRSVLENIIKELKMDDCVYLKGFCSNVYDEMSKAEIYVSTSNTEGLSNSLIEALAMGIPVIATDCPIGGARACINDGENGYLIPIKDDRALYMKMEELITMEEVRKKFQVTAIQIREELSAERISNKWMELFEK